MYVTNDYLTPNKCVKRMHYLQNETQSLLNADNLTSEGAATWKLIEKCKTTIRKFKRVKSFALTIVFPIGNISYSSERKQLYKIKPIASFS